MKDFKYAKFLGYCIKKYDAETFDHCCRVAELCDQNLETKIIALAHDLLEDTDATIEDIEYFGFNKENISTIKLLTRNKTDTYMEYIDKIIYSKNDIAIDIKIADIQDHFSEKETLKESLEERYIKALDKLYEYKFAGY